MVRLYRKNTDVATEDVAVLAQEWQPLRWPVWRYRIVEPGDASELQRGVQPWTEGIFFSAGPGPRGGTPDLYDVTGKAQELLLAALAVKVDSRESLLTFISTWGVLGVGMGLEPPPARGRPAVDSLWATRRGLDALRTHFRWLRALQARQWSSSAIPMAATPAGLRTALERLMAPPRRAELTDEAEVFRAAKWDDDPYVRGFGRASYLTRRARAEQGRAAAELHWRAFSVSITEHLRNIHPTVGWDRDAGPTPSWVLSRPIDAAWATLWSWATGGGQLHRCRHCRTWFVRQRRDQVFCTPECARRASAQAWYERKGRKQRQQQRRKGASR